MSFYIVEHDSAFELTKDATSQLSSRVPDREVHGANLGPPWVLSAPCWLHESCYHGCLLWISSKKIDQFTMEPHCSWFVFVNSLGPSDAIWRWRSWSTLVQVMACCLTAPSHYLNQCWLISKVPWHSSEDVIIIRFEDANQQKARLKNTFLKSH